MKEFISEEEIEKALNFLRDTAEDYAKSEAEKNAALIAAGHRVGGKGYDDSMQLLQRGKNDAKNTQTTKVL